MFTSVMSLNEILSMVTKCSLNHVFFSSRCAIPGLDNDTFSVQNDYHQMLINNTIPPSTDEKLTYNQCHLYTTDTDAYDDNNKPINASETKCSKWVYDDTNFKSTFTSEVGCARGWLKSSMITSLAILVIMTSSGFILQLIKSISPPFELAFET